MKNLTELKEETKNKILAKVSELLGVFDDYNDSIEEMNKETKHIKETVNLWYSYLGEAKHDIWYIEPDGILAKMKTAVRKDYLKNIDKLFGELEKIIEEAEK